MTELEWGLLDKAALAAFGALLTQHEGVKVPVKTIAKEAWEAANCFLLARKENGTNRYDAILQEYEGLDALRRILELDGDKGQFLDFHVEFYAKSPNPLLTYAKENIGYRTPGRMAVSRFLEKKAG
jgi:hypothetical protein